MIDFDLVCCPLVTIYHLAINHPLLLFHLTIRAQSCPSTKMDTSTSIFVLASFFIFPLGMPDPLKVMNPSMDIGPPMSPAMNTMLNERAADYSKYTFLYN